MTTAIVALATPVLRAWRRATQLEGGARLRGLHGALLVVAAERNGVMPTPGLENRLENVWTGREEPGQGPEDVRTNTSRHLWSMLVAQRFVEPAQLVGTTGTSPKVGVMANDDHDAHDPANDVDRDGDASGAGNETSGGLHADISDSGVPSHASYAHLLLTGQRKRVHWCDAMSAGFGLLGNRGPTDGVASGPAYERSYTLALHGPEHAWAGDPGLGDNSTRFVDTFTPDCIRYRRLDGEGGLWPDNVFAAEFGDVRGGRVGSGDVVPGFTERMGDGTTPRVRQFAELLKD